MVSEGGLVAIKAVVAGLSSGLLSIFVTRIVEKLGGVKGSIIGFLPTIVVPTSVGLALVADTYEGFQESMLAIPCTMMANSLYLYMWRFIPERLPSGYSRNEMLVATFLLTLLFWFSIAGVILAILTQVVQPAGILYVWIFSLACFVLKLSAGCFVMIYRTVPSPAGKNRVATIVLLLRGVVAASVISVGIVVSHYNQFAGGIISTFPSLFATTMVSLWLSQGQSVQNGAVGPIMVASSSVCVYSFLVSFVRPHFSVGASVGIAWTFAALYQIPVALFLFKVSSAANSHKVEEAQMRIIDDDSVADDNQQEPQEP